MNVKMERRSFLAGSLAAVGTTTLTSLAADAPEIAAGRQVFELRTYRMLRGPRLQRADEYFSKALIPALGRLGIGPVGVFTLAIGPDSPAYYVLIPHPSMESVATLAPRLAADAAYLAAGEAFLKAPGADPAYKTIDSSLMLAPEFMPRLSLPDMTARKSPRIFELRTYRSPSEPAFRKKMEMFGPGGELALFKRTGLETVFFAETLIGPGLPNLTYMLAFSDMTARDKNWGTFASDPEWKKLSTTPGYTDPEIVAEITNVILRPTGYSQI